MLEDDATDLPKACEALVDKILQRAGLFGDASTSSCTQNPKTKRVLLDLGYGCGEQTLYLTRMAALRASSRATKTLLFQQYIGITLDRTQYEFAKSRMKTSKYIEPTQTRLQSPKAPQLFCGDAGRPSSWPQDLQQAVSLAFATERPQGSLSPIETERYVLALDSAYHFQPSRREILSYSHCVLRAHFIAFDIFLAPPSSSLRSVFNGLLLRLLTPALSAPFSNFMTMSAYKRELQEAGYAVENITIEDITEDVFPGLARFLERRDQELAEFGLAGFSKWRMSGWIFKWLSFGDALRAGIVIAKWKDNASG
ncbi:hypothetical protein LOZ66_000761 [Ophidiomyces ophidiicola]|nr:hypothetical protein LOZ66_000761 [Ophidiomyces ophidiicola]